MIPFDEFRDGARVVHFAHANGYPSGGYKQFFKTLEGDLRIIAMQARPLWDIDGVDRFKNWGVLADDLITFLDEQNLKNIIGIGHSMGGISTLLAASKRPDLFSRVIMIDPVVVPRSGYLIYRLPYFLRKKMMPMIAGALRRKNQWDDMAQAQSYFRSKKVYQRFQADALDDFINAAVKEQNGKLTLTFSREWEAKIYDSLISVWPYFKKPPCPLVVIKAQYSNVITSQTWDKWQSIASDTQFEEFMGAGHLVPMEKPHELGGMVSRYL